MFAWDTNPMFCNKCIEIRLRTAPVPGKAKQLSQYLPSGHIFKILFSQGLLIFISLNFRKIFSEYVDGKGFLLLGQQLLCRAVLPVFWWSIFKLIHGDIFWSRLLKHFIMGLSSVLTERIIFIFSTVFQYPLRQFSRLLGSEKSQRMLFPPWVFWFSLTREDFGCSCHWVSRLIFDKRHRIISITPGNFHTYLFGMNFDVAQPMAVARFRTTRSLGLAITITLWARRFWCAFS